MEKLAHLVLRLVCQHWSVYAVPDGVDVWEDSLEPRVDGDTASVVTLDADIFQAEVGCERPPGQINAV